MKKFLVLACAATTFSLAAGSAMAADSKEGSLAAGSAMANSIAGRVGLTARMGFQLPANGDYGPFKNSTDAGFILGGGLIFGIDNNFAVETDITHSWFGSDIGDFGVTNVSLGAQYRFILEETRLVPYLGAGLDILLIDADKGRTVDTTLGVHVSAGVDYFLLKQLALTAEAKFVLAPDTDINGPNGVKGNFNPNSFTSTIGIRYFFN